MSPTSSWQMMRLPEDLVNETLWQKDVNQRGKDCQLQNINGQETIELPLETVRGVVLTCVVLHNILRSQYQGQHGGQQPGGDDDDDVPGDGRLIGGAADCGRDRNPAREAKRLRDYLKDYFNNEGAVAWQDGRI